MIRTSGKVRFYGDMTRTAHSQFWKVHIDSFGTTATRKLILTSRTSFTLDCPTDRAIGTSMMLRIRCID